jgi:hypothetical protein
MTVYFIMMYILIWLKAARGIGRRKITAVFGKFGKNETQFGYRC